MLLNQQALFNSKASSTKSSSLNSLPRNPTFTNSPTKMERIAKEMAEIDGNNSKPYVDQPKTHPSAHSALTKAQQTAADFNA